MYVRITYVYVGTRKRRTYGACTAPVMYPVRVCSYMTAVCISAMRNSARDSQRATSPVSRFIPLGKFRGWPLYNSAAAAAADLYTHLTYIRARCTCVQPRLPHRSQRRRYKHRYYLLHHSQKLGATRDSADSPRWLLSWKRLSVRRSPKYRSAQI